MLPNLRKGGGIASANASRRASGTADFTIRLKLLYNLPTIFIGWLLTNMEYFFFR